MLTAGPMTLIMSELNATIAPLPCVFIMYFSRFSRLYYIMIASVKLATHDFTQCSKSGKK